MTQITLILGGARSGKSTYAENLARQSGLRVLYLATATAGDDEMAARIAAHQAIRPADWHTLEAPTQLGPHITQAYADEEVLLIDCITLLASNVLLGLAKPVTAPAYDAALDEEFEGLRRCIASLPLQQLLLVSNEVGLGLVPEYPLGRLYRDGLGRLNQKLAQYATRVVLMVAGIPLVVK